MKAHSFMQPYANALISGDTLISGYGQVMSSEYDLTPLLGQDVAIYARGYSADLAVAIDNLGVPQTLKESLALNQVIGVITLEDSLQKKAKSRWVLNDYNVLYTVKKVYVFPFALETSEAVFDWSEPVQHATDGLEQIANCFVCGDDRFKVAGAIINRDGFEHKHTCVGGLETNRNMLNHTIKFFKTLELDNFVALNKDLERAIDTARLSYPKEEQPKAIYNFKGALGIGDRTSPAYYAANIIALHLFAAYRDFDRSYMDCLELTSKYVTQQTKQQITLPDQTAWGVDYA